MASLETHKSVSADFVMVAFAATEGTSGVGPGAVFATVASCSTSKALAPHGLDEVFKGTTIGSCWTGAGGINLHSHGVSLDMSGYGAGGISS